MVYMISKSCFSRVVSNLHGDAVSFIEFLTVEVSLKGARMGGFRFSARIEYECDMVVNPFFDASDLSPGSWPNTFVADHCVLYRVPYAGI